MDSKERLKNDLEILHIEENVTLTIKLVTAKYKRLAKEKHPDREGGKTCDFQELQGAYKRVIKLLENEENVSVPDEFDYEKEFFMKNNFMKECTNSFVIYIQESLVSNWKRAFERHLKVHRFDKGRLIFKTGEITLTLYEKPKKDPRSKIHIQSSDQQINLEFIMDKLASFYKEVSISQDKAIKATKKLWVEKAVCSKCGKFFTNKKGVKQHILRMHAKKDKITALSQISESPPEITLDETVTVLDSEAEIEETTTDELSPPSV